MQWLCTLIWLSDINQWQNGQSIFHHQDFWSFILDNTSLSRHFMCPLLAFYLLACTCWCCEGDNPGCNTAWSTFEHLCYILIMLMHGKDNSVYWLNMLNTCCISSIHNCLRHCQKLRPVQQVNVHTDKYTFPSNQSQYTHTCIR